MMIVDRQIAPDVLKHCGVVVLPNMVQSWSDDQVQRALVWADSVMSGRPIDRPKHLGAFQSVNDMFVMCGRKIERVDVSQPNVITITLDGGIQIRIRLDGD
jgi:hypothetical protein